MAYRWTQLCNEFHELQLQRERFHCCNDALLFARHVNQLDVGKGYNGSGLEATHGSDSPFAAAMILLDGLVHVFTGPDSDGVTSL